MENQLVIVVVVICGTAIGLAALWRKKNVELRVCAKHVGVQLRVIEPAASRAQAKPALGVRGEAE
jgi:hypothetical protein